MYSCYVYTALFSANIIYIADDNFFAGLGTHIWLFRKIIVHPTDDQKSCSEGVQW